MSRTMRIIRSFVLVVLTIPVLFAQPLSPRIANYYIDVRLEPETRTLTGHQVLSWTNPTETPAEELQFHLYLNAFESDRTTFMRESGGVMRGQEIGEDGWGSIKVERLGPTEVPSDMEGSADWTDRIEFIQPDDENEHDRTVFRLPLPKPVPPGETIFLEIDFTALLPTPPFARTGALEEYFFAGQWFPKIGVFEEGGWNCHQFHANSEFFADFGVYDVSITLPKEFIVGATGQRVEHKDNPDGTATHRYLAEDVHDFAWTASPEFVEFTGEVQDVEIRALVQPDHAYQGERHLEAAKVAVAYFQDHYGDYPYPNLTVVDPRRGAGGSGGMEYPTLITAGTFYGLPEGVRLLELVIIHEFGHNFWYHLVASNEFEEPWLDEGINTYTHGRIMADAYGPTGDAIDFLGLEVNAVDACPCRSYIFDSKADPVRRKAWEFVDGSSYGTNSYQKPALILETLRNAIGPETMKEVLRTYVERWRFKHPKTRDFIEVLNDVTGEDWSWYLDQALDTNAVLDYAVDSVETTPEGDEFKSDVLVRRKGEFIFPVELEVRFEDGQTVLERWDGSETWKKFTYVRPDRLVSATVDPERKVLLDVSYTNNSRTVEIQSAGVNKLTFRWLFLWQCLMELLSL